MEEKSALKLRETVANVAKKKEEEISVSPDELSRSVAERKRLGTRI